MAPLLRVAAGGAMLLMLAVGCGGGSEAVPFVMPEGGTDLTGQPSVTIAMTDNRYETRIAVITEGTAITWVNEGRNDHDAIPDVEGWFDPVTPLLAPGESATRTFDDLGTITYYCSIHGAPGRGQWGTIVVLREGVAPGQ